MKIDNMQTDEFYQLDLNQQNFEGSNDTWGGLFSGGRYGFEKKPIQWVTEYAKLRPVELITEVGPVPPRRPDWANHGNAHENVPCWAPAHGLGDRTECSVPDSGATIMLLGAVLVALSIWRWKCTG